MRRLRSLWGALWKHKWAIVAFAVVGFLLLREWSPPAYRITDARVPVHGQYFFWGDPVTVTVSRCNDTSQTTLIHYVRRIVNEETNEVWPLQEGALPVDPGCLTRRVEVGFVPYGVPAGTWRVRTDYESTNWLFKKTHTWWVSDPLEVVAATRSGV